MKFSASISVLSIALSTTMSFSPAVMALEAYKTKSDQVVVTGLKAKQKYDIQYKKTTGKNGQRQVNTNACGEALIAKAAKFQSVMIDGQSLEPKTLTLKEHKKCSRRSNAIKTRTSTRTILPSVNSGTSSTGAPN
jgi:hypothetical protein